MTINNIYAVWNNKGGVGKSTITFHLAARYAETHPDVNVLVMDLCPQANVSMMLLGGGTSGENQVLQFCGSETPHTVVGYLSTVIASGPGAALPDPHQWIVQPSVYNSHLSENLFLMCGDGNLEPMAPLISDRAAAPPLTPSLDPWRWVHLVVRNFIEDIHKRYADEKWMVFIDTNPSFSIYTEIAVSSATRLIVPVNADDSSRVAITAMFTLLHGSSPPHPVYGRYTFAEKAKERKMQMPQVHLIVGNRLTQHDGPAAAFEAMTDATTDTLYDAFKANPARFSPPTSKLTGKGQFRKAYSVPLRDFNTAGVVSAHLGFPLSKLTTGYYDVHDRRVSVDVRRVRDCEEALDDILKRL